MKDFPQSGLLTEQRLPAAEQQVCSPDCSVACIVEHQVGRVAGSEAQRVGLVGRRQT